MTDLNTKNQDQTDIHHYAESAYLSYAMSVVKGRAIPMIEDGQKPVQRRILYAMQQMGMTSSSKHVKSARVVGEILGKYHPHGDSSVYEAAVRIAQPFTLRYPLIDGQGNFGSRDGDNAAAMRYTEMRLTPIAEMLLSELKLGTVDFKDNYDGAFREPVLLPARLPFLLMNGASGVAVGMATEIPPHNLRELSEAAYYLLKKSAKDKDFAPTEKDDEKVFEHVKGPDFPTGAQIITSAESIATSYREGSGKIRLRATWHTQALARNDYKIIIDSLPHEVSAAKILKEIEELSNPTIRKKEKSITPKQLQLKQQILGLIDRVQDRSGEKIELIIEPKTSKVDPEELMQWMLAHTSLESSYAMNLTMLDRTSSPVNIGLTEILWQWCTFRLDTILSRTRFILQQKMDRQHILEGRLIAFVHINEIIKLIQTEEQPKVQLMARYHLSDTQAEDILEIKLRQLAKLEGIKLESELAQLKSDQSDLNLLINNHDLLCDCAIKELKEDTKKFGDDRRTLLLQAESVSVKQVVKTHHAKHAVSIVYTKLGLIKTKSGHNISDDLFNLKVGDKVLEKFECSSDDTIAMFDTSGRVYTIDIARDLLESKQDIPINSVLTINNAKPAYFISGNANSEDGLLISKSDSYGFLVKFKHLLSKNKAGKAFITLDGAELHKPITVADHIDLVSSDKYRVIIPTTEVKELPGGGKGIILMKLHDGEKLKQPAALVTIHHSQDKYISRRAKIGLKY